LCRKASGKAKKKEKKIFKLEALRGKGYRAVLVDFAVRYATTNQEKLAAASVQQRRLRLKEFSWGC
jgi:hypothetical protein